ncbi:MAG: hypothetical protein QMD01_02205 [Thermodesulfovibrionales bacterium]|nr:hypothetical protein [Thermodesulfovibrionales bacterium]
MVGVIDIGSNTIRVLIGYIKDGKLTRIAADRYVTRLGRNMLKNGLLDEDGIEESILSLIKIKALCESFGAKKIVAVGTSALREARNNNEFLERVKKETGIRIEIISGEKEAELTLKGILTSGLSYQTCFIVDVGGGSTEWIYYTKDGGQSLNMGSVPIGAVKLSESFIRHDPPTPEELTHIKNFISQQLFMALDLSLITNHQPLTFIATGGTATTIAAIDKKLCKYEGEKVHEHRISHYDMKAIYEKLTTLSFDDRAKLKGLEPDRAGIIIPGTFVLLIFMEILKTKEMIVSDYGLLEGLLVSNA